MFASVSTSVRAIGARQIPPDSGGMVNESTENKSSNLPLLAQQSAVSRNGHKDAKYFSRSPADIERLECELDTPSKEAATG